jgi:hypothetical protein
MAQIFESPDKGETVYVREAGLTDRALHSESDRRQNLRGDIMESQLWSRIHREAKVNPTLQEALNRVKITYYLTADYEKHYGKK